MSTQIDKLPADVKAQLALKYQRRDLGHIVKIYKAHGIPPAEYGELLNSLIKSLYRSRMHGVILTAYKDHGQLSEYTVPELLLGMFASGDYAAFLKQAHRFGFYKEFPDKIEAAIAWHRDKGMADTVAWERKFAELRAALE